MRKTLQWGHRLSAMETSRSGSRCRSSSSTFNGATAFRRWKPGTRLAITPCMAHLQWGHRLSAMETLQLRKFQREFIALQWGHRLSAMETSRRRRFRHPHGRAPSMGPPPFGDGNIPLDGEAWANQLILQWGHRLSAMETWRGTPTVPTPRPFNGATAFRRWKPLLAPKLGFLSVEVRDCRRISLHCS